jgi:hypothetical protein
MIGRPDYLTKDSLFTVKIMKLREAEHLLGTLRPWLFGDKANRADIMLKFLRRRIASLTGVGHNGMHGGFRPGYDAEDWRTLKEFMSLGGRSTKMSFVEGVLNEFEQRIAEGPGLGVAA